MSHRKFPSRVFEFPSQNLDNHITKLAENGNFDTLKSLWKQGVDLTRENLDLLLISSTEGHIAIVIFLIDIGVKIPDLALIKASENGHLVVVKYLLEKGANLHADSDLALKLAVSNGHSKVVRYLIKHGSIITNEHIDIATKNGHKNILDIIN